MRAPRSGATTPPRDLTCGSSHSLGPIRACVICGSDASFLRQASPSLPSEGLRASIPARSSTTALLWSALPGEGQGVAALASRASIPVDAGGAGAPSPAESTLSRAAAAAAGRGSRCPGGSGQGARGPAEARISRRFFRQVLRPARLLRHLRAAAARAAATFLFMLLPSSFTASARA